MKNDQLPIMQNFKKLISNLNSAKSKSIKITIIYFIFGCIWIVVSDIMARYIFIDSSSILAASIIKGLFYVLITAILIYVLIYTAFKKLLNTQEAVGKANEELCKSTELYKDLYQEHNKKQALLKSLINSTPDLIFYKNTDFVYLGCNKAFEDFAGKQEVEIIGRTDMELFDADMAKLFRTIDIATLSQNSPQINNVEIMHYPNGQQAYFETLKSPYYDHEGKVIGLIGVGRNITERKKREEEIIYLNHHDLLTDLYNRTYLQKEIQRLNNEEHLPLSVVIGDINGLKLINDSFGHAEGDRLIVEISNILKHCCGHLGIIARTGGDEFTILLPKTDSAATQKIIERIKSDCEAKAQEIDTDIHFTNISLGYATKSCPEESLEKTIQIAEDFMYKQKLFEYKSLHSSILSSIKRTMAEKSHETEEHAERLRQLSRKLGQALSLTEEELVALELLSTLHDIGKISIDSNILEKKDRLTDEDWREIKKHPEVGYRITQASPDLIHISEYILSHHEHWDGGGYPQGLKGAGIPLLSRILAIVDAFDAMSQDRAYRKALTKQQAIKELLKYAGTQFDPEIVRVFVEKVLN
jgi:diguanylate cyclase (GGDEF)-like protein/PAS domain S-box-containing protein